MKEYKNYMPIRNVYDTYFGWNPQIVPETILGMAINRCYYHDTLIMLPQIPDNTFDSIITDPPFAIGHGASNTGNYNRTASNVIEGYHEIDALSYPEFSRTWISEAYRVLNRYGSLWVVSGWSNQKDILNAIDDAGFYLKNQFIFKHNFGLFAKHIFTSSHYNVFFCTKHKSRYVYNKLLWYSEDVMEDTGDIPVEIWEIKKEYWTGKIKPPNKLPQELVELMIGYGTRRNDLILDCFSGSGTILNTARSMGRNCLAWDIVPAYVDIANHKYDD